MNNYTILVGRLIKKKKLDTKVSWIKNNFSTLVWVIDGSQDILKIITQNGHLSNCSYREADKAVRHSG